MNFFNFLRFSKMLKLFLFFSFLFNLLISNGYSYILLVNTVDTLYGAAAIFKIDSNYIVFSKTVKKDVKSILSANANIFNIAGLVDSLFVDDSLNTTNEKNNAKLNNKKIDNLFFSMFDCFYIFSLSDSISHFKVNDFYKNIANKKYDNLDNIKNRNIDNNKILLYDSIKELFVIQNIENHSKIFLNIANRLNAIKV